jgi:D-arabinose 1-dehydrogenase-like Zn-dependent alcohol dehydrogenase
MWSRTLKALTWHGKAIRCENVPDPRIEDGRDAIIKVTACAICGSDLHIFDGVIPSMESGDVLGHETMGERGTGPDPASGDRSGSHSDVTEPFEELVEENARLREAIAAPETPSGGRRA